MTHFWFLTPSIFLTSESQVKWEEYAKLRPRSDILRPRHVLSAVELVVVRKGHESEAEEGGSGNWEAKDEDDVTLIEVHPHITSISTIDSDGQRKDQHACLPSSPLTHKLSCGRHLIR